MKEKMKEKKKVLVYSLDKRDTTAFWRSLPMKYLYHDDFIINDISSTNVFDWSTFINNDIFWMQRPFAREHSQVIQAAKNMGLKVILDYDDLLLNNSVDMYNPTHRTYRDNQSYIVECMKLADEIWVSTDAIKESIYNINSNVFLIKNSHNDYLFNIYNKLPFKYNKKCFYRGGGSHQADVYESADKLLDIINNNDDWIFTFCGDRFTYLEINTGDNYHIVEGMTIMEYFKYINMENPSIMIFPLCTTPFNKGKSNISWIESTYSGSAFFGNKNLPEFNNENILSLNDFNGYFKDNNILKSNNEKSWEYICDNLLLSKTNLLRMERILANL